LALNSVFPAFAETITAAFNSINIFVNGTWVAAVGEQYTLENGTSVPFSIIYNGTTYLPLRKIGEIYDKDIRWDGESRTAYLNDKDGSQSYPIPTTAPTATPAPTPAPSSVPKIAMYSDFPTVPDFGAFSGAKLLRRQISGDATVYRYDISSFQADILPDYFVCLTSNGFRLLGTFESDEGWTIRVYTNDISSLSMGIINDDFGIMLMME